MVSFAVPVATGVQSEFACLPRLLVSFYWNVLTPFLKVLAVLGVPGVAAQS